MSKKRFTEGLESIFGNLEEETLQEDNPLLSSGRPKKKSGESSKRPSSGKDFSSDLHAFLQDAFEESLEEQLEQREKKRQPLPASAKVKKRHRKPASGLDALIRSTVEPTNIRLDETSSKRITLSIDPDKLEKLKAIARRKKAYLRDVIDEIVAEFLDEYEKKKK